MVVPQSQLNNPLGQLQLLLGLVQDVAHRDYLPFTYRRRKVGVENVSLHHVGEQHVPVSAGTRQLGTVAGPGQFVDATGVGLLQWSRPLKKVDRKYNLDLA